MATFTDIIKSQRSQGAGVMGSLSTALSRSAMQKMDPRNYLFNKDGAMVALFPSLKGYQYGSKPSSSKISGSGLSEGFSSGRVELITDKLDVIDINTKTIAKNSLVLPSMARDMFLVKQNIIKLVKLQGGNPQIKAGDWFSRQQAREQAYESKFGKTSTSPTAVGGGEKKEGGIFSFLTGILTGGFISKIIGGLLKGGLLTAMVMGIGKYFTDGDFRKSVNETVGKILNTVFGEGWHKNLLSGISLVTGAFVAFKFAIGTISAVIAAAAAKIASSAGLPLPGRIPGKGKSAGRGGSRLGMALSALVIGKQIYDNFSSKKESENASNIVPSGGAGMDNADQSTTQQSGTNWSNVGSKVIDVSLSGAHLIASLPKGAMLKRVAQFALKAASKGWLPRILAKFIARKFSKMFAFKVASFLGGLAVPGAGWVWSALNATMLAYDIYIIYNAIFGAGGILEELEKEDVAANGSAPKMAERTDSVYESNPNEYVNAKQYTDNSMNASQRSGSYSTNSSQRYMMPTPVSSQNISPMMDTATAGVFGGNTGVASPSGFVGNLLDFIGKYESKGDYNKLVGGRSDPTLTTKTVGEVLQMQGQMLRGGHESTAVGKYQIVRKTLQGLVKSGVVSLTDRFDKNTQDRLGTALLKRRGLDSYLSGKMDADTFADNLSKEWAALPFRTSRSFYAGVGSNRSGVARSSFMQVLAGTGGSSPTGMMAGSSMGSSLNGMSAQVASDQRQQSVTVVPVVNSQTPQVAQQSAPPAQLMPAEVMDSDLMRELFRKRPIQYVG